MSGGGAGSIRFRSQRIVPPSMPWRRSLNESIVEDYGYCCQLWFVGHMKGCFFVSRYNSRALAGAGRIPGCLEGQIVGASSQGEMSDDLVAIVS